MYAVCIRFNSKTEPLGSECFKHLIMVMLRTESFCYLTTQKLIQQVVHGSWKGKINCKGTTQWPRLQASVNHPACSVDFTASLEESSSSLPDLILTWDATRCMTSRTLGRTPWKGSCFLPGGTWQLHSPSHSHAHVSAHKPICASYSSSKFDSRTKCHKFKLPESAQKFCSSHLTFVWPQERWYPKIFQPNSVFHRRKTQLPRAGATCVRKWRVSRNPEWSVSGWSQVAPIGWFVFCLRSLEFYF